MADPSPVSFEQQFGSVFSVELRRQGVADFAKLSSQLQQRTKRRGLTNLVIDAQGMGLSNRACVALIEALLKISAATLQASSLQTAPEWIVRLSNNQLSDRVQGHLVLLMQKLPRLTELHIDGNSGVSKGAQERLVAEARSIEEQSGGKRRLLCICQAPIENNATDANHPISVPPADVSVGLAQQQPASIVPREPISGLRTSSQQRQRAHSPSRGASKSRSPQRPNAPKSQVATAHRATSAPRRSPGPAQPQLQKTQPRPTSRERHERGRSSEASKRQSARTPSPESTQPKLLKTSSSQRITQPVAAAAPPAVQRVPAATEPFSSRQPPPRSRSSSVSTTATEVPDEQDGLDITANLNPMVDHVVSLEHQGVPIDVFRKRLKQALSVPQGLTPSGVTTFGSVTILNLPGNQLTVFDTSILPASLLRLDLSDNLLSSMPPLGICSMLSVLNVRRNRIERVGNALSENLNLGHLFLGRNLIDVVEGIGHLWLLETLDLSYNRINSVSALRALSLNGSLRHLLVQGNPFTRTVSSATASKKQQKQVASGNGAPRGVLANSATASYRPVLRNLCPSLIAVDNVRLAFSAAAEKQQNNDKFLLSGARGTSRSPQREPPSATKTHDSGSIANRYVGYAVRNMLQRGVGGVTAGYSDPVREISRVKQIHKPRSDGNPKAGAVTAASRKDVMAALHKKSKEFLEKTIVERLTNAQRLAELQGIQEAEAPHSRPPAIVTPAASNTNSPVSQDHATPRGIVRSEALDFEKRWHAEHEQARLAALSPPSPPSELPILSGELSPETYRNVSDVVHEEMVGLYGNIDRRSASTREPDAQVQQVRKSPVAAIAKGTNSPRAGTASQTSLAYRPTASSLSRAQASLEKPRSQPQSRSSSRSPSPVISDPKKVVAIHENDALHSAIKKMQATPKSEATPYPLLSHQKTPKAGTVAVVGTHTATPTSRKLYPRGSSSAAPHTPVPATQRPSTTPQRRVIEAYDSVGRVDSEIVLSPVRDEDKSPEETTKSNHWFGTRRQVDNLGNGAPLHDSPGGHLKYSPIRSNVELEDVTDLSMDGAAFASRLVPTMDPGDGASPLPRPAMSSSSQNPAQRGGRPIGPHETPVNRQKPRVGALKPPTPTAVISPSLRDDSPPTPMALLRPPLASRSPARQAEEVRQWSKDFFHDLSAIKTSLRAVVSLVWSCLNAPDAGTAADLIEERRRCLEILAKSNVLNDTEMPRAVVDHYGITVDELNASSASATENMSATDALSSERFALLQGIREMGSAKTCLRYIVALVDAKRDDLLRRYIEQIRS